MNAHASTRPGSNTEGDDGVVAAIPTCARGLVVAAVTLVLVAAAGVCAVSAYLPPLESMRSMMTSSARPPTHEVRATSRVHADDSIVELDTPGKATETSSRAAAGPVEIDATKGALALPLAAAGHRVYIDGRVVGSPPSEIRVSCGPHLVRVGSLGRDRQVVVPCGGDVFIAYP